VTTLIDNAQTRVTAENYPAAIATADRVATALRSMRKPRFDLFTGLASVYWYAGRFDASRSFYEASIAAVGVGTPGTESDVVPLLTALCGVEARLGRGADARKEIALARQLATNVEAQSPNLLLETMMLEAYLQQFAGDADAAVATLLEAEQFGKEHGLLAAPASRLRIAQALINAGAYDESLVRIREMLKQPLLPEDRARASEELVRASALHDPGSELPRRRARKRSPRDRTRQLRSGARDNR
jgi:tetratricopeptide (TPR) repeat protein